MIKNEVRKFEKEEWKQVPAKMVLEKLADCFNPATLVITNMQQGSEGVAEAELNCIRS